MERDICAEVLVEVATRKIEQGFHYAVPSGLAGKLKVGSRVLVPFGGRKVPGYVTGFGPPPGSLPEELEIKAIGEVLDEGPVFTPGQMELAGWMADYYLCPVISALKAIIWPRIQGVGPKRVKGLFPSAAGGSPVFGPRAAKRELVWATALAHPGMSRKELAAAAGVSPALVDKLVSEGLLRYGEMELRRDPYPAQEPAVRDGFRLTPDQAAALEQIKMAADRSKREVFLLYGVTGSGKTEVYLRAIAHVLSMGRQALVMVPEISLTPQMVSAFKGCFGDRVAVLHSRLSDGERYDEWNRIACGAAPVVLGARSAAFAPLAKPGLIILDEEHEPSYKQEETPRYHARDVVLRLAGQFEAVAVLGSATPSVESFCRAQPGGPYRLITIPGRVEMRPMPEVRVIDMREEFRDGNPGVLSRRLVSAVQDRLARREQVILFLNRRGYATLVACRECGLVMKCPHCDISLTYHTGGRLCCHYCNYTTAARGYCPDCGSRFMENFGTGTQKVEEEVKKLFPAARMLRMDSDTTARKGSHAKILRIFKEGGADILIGTQMVAKGLDIPLVTLVGVINADISLHMPDFRSAERTFQLVAQVAGRTGRGDLGGEVLVQTMSPDHYSIVRASRHDYAGFYEQEMRVRRALRYPPFTRLARVLVSGRDEAEVKGLAERWVSVMEGLAGASGGREVVEILGPAPAPLTRIRGRYRYHVIVKSKSGKMMRGLLRSAMDRIEAKTKSGAVAAVDIDPQNMM
ncbi:MAG: primosomal protein N' [Peptococcaceae bacterium]|nr:primosomal protein N' [Peptococcaceae bacterium]